MKEDLDSALTQTAFEMPNRPKFANLDAYTCALEAHSRLQNARISELTDLLTSAHAIAKRNGDGTNFKRFSDRLTAAGIGSVTPKTFRMLPSDI